MQSRRPDSPSCRQSCCCGEVSAAIVEVDYVGRPGGGVAVGDRGIQVAIAVPIAIVVGVNQDSGRNASIGVCFMSGYKHGIKENHTVVRAADAEAAINSAAPREPGPDQRSRPGEPAHPDPCGRRLRPMAASPTRSIRTSSNMSAARRVSSLNCPGMTESDETRISPTLALTRPRPGGQYL